MSTLAPGIDGILDGFRDDTAETSNRSVKRFKEAGRPVIGHFCSYVPVEVVTAAGALPVRLRGIGSTDSGAADSYLSSRTCTYVRHTLAAALQGEYDFLDGEIGLNTCDHVRRAFDLWRSKTGVAYHGFVSVPRNARESLYPYYREEIERLVASLEGHFGVEVTLHSLEAAIREHNGMRSRLRRLDAFRSAPRPALNGAGMLTVTIASLVLPPEDFNPMADRLIEALESAPDEGESPRARLLLAGAELDEPAFVEAIESQGGVVAADSLCFGMRAHEAVVEEGTGDPLEAICRRYFFKVPCARMILNFPDRLGALLEAVKVKRIDGVVFQRLKFCDPWGGEAHNLRNRLKTLGIPFLSLEREYGRVHAGQVRTRIQAFHELMESSARREGRA